MSTISAQAMERSRASSGGRALAAAAMGLAAASSTASAAVVDFSSVPIATQANGLVIGDASFSASSLPVFLGDPAIVTDNTQFQYVDGHYLIGTATAGNFLAVDFANPVTDITFGFAGPTALPEVLTASVTLFGEGAVNLGTFPFDTDTVTNDMNGSIAFVQEGLANLTGVTDPVSRMEITFTFSLPFSQSFKFDNLSYTAVPAPSAALTLATGALMMTRRRRDA